MPVHPLLLMAPSSPKREKKWHPIRSYVLRQGRLTPAQARALENHWQRYGIDFSTTPLDLNRVFNRPAPKIVEIGSGMGDVTLALARAHPENDYLAVEVHKPGVGSLLREASLERVENIRVISHDIVAVLKAQLSDKSLDEVYIFFPDPWPKKRHHKRRLVNTDFMTLLTTKLKSHARIFLATDWRDLAEQMLEVCDAQAGLINLAGKGHYAPRPHWRPLTKFEQRGHRLEHQVWDLVYAPVA